MMAQAALTACFLLLACGLEPEDDAARYVAGSPPAEDRVRLVRIAPLDGNPRAETQEGRACLRTDRHNGNPYIYFDVSRRWLKEHGHEPYSVEATILYYDDHLGQMAVQYDAVGDSVEANYHQAAWNGTASGTWRKAVVMLDNAELRNGQQGQADLRIAASSAGDLRIASVALRVVAASAAAPPKGALPRPRLPGLDETVVVVNRASVICPSPPNEAERIALERLDERFMDVRGAKPRHGAGSNGPAIVVGRWRGGMARSYPRTAEAVRRLQAESEAFRRRDGYVVCVERTGHAPVVCAVGLASPGAVYAIGHLHSRLMRDGSRVIMTLDRRPIVHRPQLDQREVYLNIGYGLGRPGITAEFWTDEDWRAYIDHLILARFNTWSFYLWGDSALIHPAARTNRALNVRLHERLRKAIAYSHRRGMRVGHQFTPSMLPVELWNEKPAIRAKLEYDYPGTVCPSHAEAKPLIREIYGTELRWFRDVDFRSLWFYDVGGCFCDTCRAPEAQLASLLEQVRTFSDLAHQTNPRAAFQVMTWAIWRYEKRHSYTIRDRFVREVVAWFRSRKRALQMADGICVDPETKPLLDLAAAAGVPAKAFLYQTNIETGQPFPILLTRYFRRWVPELVRARATSAFIMRIEAGTKVADDLVAGAYLWNPRVSPAHALMDCARLVTGDVRASRLCWEALHRMDAFAWFGHAGGAGPTSGETIARLTRQAVLASPPRMQNRLEWLATSGDAYRILGHAVEAHDNEDAETVARLDREFALSMSRSRLFKHQAQGAPYWVNLFRRDLVRFFHAGWRTYHF